MEEAWISVVNYIWIPATAAALFAAMMACMETGYRIGKKRAAKEPDGYAAGTSVITGALITLLGLLLGFSFGTAETRFDRRREMIVQEANAIGTAYLRVDTLPAREQPALRDLFRKYLDTRLEAYGSVPDLGKAISKTAQAEDISGEIWKLSERASRGANRTAVALLALPAINNMIDIASARKSALLHHLPLLIIVLQAGLSLVCSIMIGHRMSVGKKRNLFFAVLFAAAVSVTFYVILDLETPRFGLIRLDLEDKALFDLQKSMRKNNFNESKVKPKKQQAVMNAEA
jgi:hypothetical protein